MEQLDDLIFWLTRVSNFWNENDNITPNYAGTPFKGLRRFIYQRFLDGATVGC